MAGPIHPVRGEPQEPPQRLGHKAKTLRKPWQAMHATATRGSGLSMLGGLLAVIVLWALAVAITL